MGAIQKGDLNGSLGFSLGDTPVTGAPGILPEIAEADASESVRIVYAGLRDGAASPIAALIWRHIATYPGLLEACWQSLKPLFESGQMADIAWRVARETTPDGLLPRIAPRAQVALGIAADDALTIQALVEAYNRANPVNLLGIQTLLARLESNERPQPTSGKFHTRPAAITRPLPYMTPPAEMSDEIRWLLNDLRFGDRSQLETVVPSLYRHLTGWPAYLGALHISLAPRFRDGSMETLVANVESAMADEAGKLARQMEPIDELGGKSELQVTMRRFTGGFIPMMIVVGRGMAGQFQ